jgi:glycosyltransferase involved in cell wall biosynthesis
VTDYKISNEQLAQVRQGDLSQVEADASGITKDTHFCAPGRASRYRYGVEYRGNHETVHDGTNVAVRRHARALAEAGMPVLLTSPTGHVIVDGISRPTWEVGLPAAVEHEVGGLRRSEMSERTVRIVHAVVKSAEALQALVLPRSVSEADPELADYVLHRTVLYTVWERDRISDDVARVMQSVGECWVPCQQNAEMLRSCGVSNVFVVPHPFDPSDPLEKMRRRIPSYRPQGGDTRRFYTIGAWQPRKAQHELLGAWLEAFGPEEDATLTIKTHGRWPGYPDPETSIQHWMQHPAVRARGWHPDLVRHKVRIVDDHLTNDGIRRLHFDNNIYLACSHGEAWCLPAFDAKQAGNRLVHVGYGGTADFASEDDISVPYELEPVHESYAWEDGAQWASVDHHQLVAALRRAQPPDDYASSALDDRFRIDQVGELMRRRILSLLVDDDDARDYLEQRRTIEVKGYPPQSAQQEQEPQAKAAARQLPSRWERIQSAVRRLWR